MMFKNGLVFILISVKGRGVELKCTVDLSVPFYRSLLPDFKSGFACPRALISLPSARAPSRGELTPRIKAVEGFLWL